MRIILLVLVLLSLPNLLFAQDKMGIYMEVSGERESEVSSYIKRELRELGDVVFVDLPSSDSRFIRTQE